MSRTAVVFDLDGTLIDSAPDLARAANAVLAEAGQAPLGLAEVVSFIGNGVPRLVELVAKARGLTNGPELVDRFMTHYNAAPVGLTRPYPGAVAALEALRAAGHKMAICTNKPEAPAREILAALELEGFFDAVLGGDSLAARKPDPRPLTHVIAELGAERAVYVGDSEVDAETADRAGVPFLLFTEGYRKGPADAMVQHAAFSDFAALAGLVRAFDPKPQAKA